MNGVSWAYATKQGNTVYQYKGQGLSMGTMVAGWDKRVRELESLRSRDEYFFVV